MKKQAFNNYVDVIANTFDMKRKAIFTKSKLRGIVDARHMQYYACDKNGIETSYIISYMAENGYKITRQSIVHGIIRMKDKINSHSNIKQLAESICIQ